MVVGMAHSRLYIRIMNSKEWRSVRAKKLQMQPWCEECLKENPPRVTPAQAVHHKIEIESQRTEADAWSVGLAICNLESVCFACHRKIHEGSHTRNAHKRRDADRLAAWISQQRGDNAE